MATWKYKIIIPNNTYLKHNGTVTATMYRESPSNVPTAYVLSSTTGTLSSDATILTYAGDVQLSFGTKYGKTAQLAANSNQHSISGVSVTGIDNELLSKVTDECVSVKITCSHPGGSGNGIYLKGTTFTLSVSVTEYDYKKDTITTTQTDPYSIGNAITIRITDEQKGVANISHKVTYAIGTNTFEATLASVQPSTKFLDYVISINSAKVLSAFKDMLIIGMAVTVETMYAGNVFGSDIKSFNITLPDTADYRPTVNSVTVTLDNSDDNVPAIIKNNNLYVSGYSKLKFTIDAKAPAEASISGYDVVLKDAFTITKQTKDSPYTITTGVINRGGQLSFDVITRDTRNRTTTVTKTITFMTYFRPTLSGVNSFFCTNQGVFDSTGTYLYAAATCKFSDLSGKNTATLTIRDEYGNVMYSQSMSTHPYNFESYSKSVSAATHIKLTFTLTDSLGNSVSEPLTVWRAPYAIHVKNGGNGVAFGQICSQEGAVQIAPTWELYFHDKSDTNPQSLIGINDFLKTKLTNADVTSSVFGSQSQQVSLDSNKQTLTFTIAGIAQTASVSITGVLPVKKQGGDISIRSAPEISYSTPANKKKNAMISIDARSNTTTSGNAEGWIVVYYVIQTPFA